MWLSNGIPPMNCIAPTQFSTINIPKQWIILVLSVQIDVINFVNWSSGFFLTQEQLVWER